MYRYLLLLIFAISHFSLKHFFVETLDKDETCHVGFVGYWDQTLHDLADRVPGLMLQGSLIFGLISVTKGIEGWIQKVWELTTFIARSLGFKLGRRMGGTRNNLARARATTLQRRSVAIRSWQTACLNYMQVVSGLCLFFFVINLIKIDSIQTGISFYYLVLHYIAVSLIVKL